MASDSTSQGQFSLKPKGNFQIVANENAKPVGPVGIMSKSQKAAQSSQGPIDIAFVFDATASRESTWKKAQKIQSEMIGEYATGADDVHVGIIVHRGSRVENLGWFNRASSARDVMAGVRCQAGGTRIEKGLKEALKGRNDSAPKAVIIVGDCCEEDESDMRKIAHKLKDRNVPVHSFHEGDNSNGEKMYKMIADATGGAYAKFGPNMPLKDLVGPLFVHTVKGPEAFNALLYSGDKGAQALANGGLLRIGLGGS